MGIDSEKLDQGLQKYCSCCHFLCTPQNHRRKSKAAAAFVFGFLLGVLLYLLVLMDLGFNATATFCMAFSICVTIGVGNAISSQVRCISLLTIPAFCGKTGRNALKTLILAYLLAGPFANLSLNAKEVVRVFGCTTSLAYNLTKTRFSLMVKPYQEGIKAMRYDRSEIEQALERVRTVVEPVVREVEDEEEVAQLMKENDYVDNLQGDTLRSQDIENKYKHLTKRAANSYSGEEYELKYRRKLEYRCEDVMSKGAERCRELFSNAYDKCYEKVSYLVAWLLCWPMKLTFICNLAAAFGGKSLCDPAKQVEPGFGEGYSSLKDMKEALGREMKDVKIQFQLKSVLPNIDVFSAAEIAKSITKEFTEKKDKFDVVVMLVKRLLALVFLKIICRAEQYHERYLSDIEFDNKYITDYFKRIDSRRRRKGQKVLLPLKKIERQKLLDPKATLPVKEERRRVFLQLFQLLIEMLTATTFIMLDYLFAETLDIVAQHAHMEYTQQGKHDVNLKVIGTGMLAKIIRSIVKGFTVKKRIHVVHSNKACLPRATHLPSYYSHKIYGLYLLILAFIFIETYTLRLNRLICAYFYPKRERRRVIFIYNETLKRRYGFFRHMRTKIRRQAQEDKLVLKANWLLALRLKTPRKFGWIKYLPQGRRQCTICEEPEPVKTGVMVSCPTPGCYLVYCRECWSDIGEICYGCASFDSEEDTALEEEDFIY